MTTRIRIKRRRGGIPRQKHRTKGGAWFKWFIQMIEAKRKRQRKDKTYATVDELMKAEVSPPRPQRDEE